MRKLGSDEKKNLEIRLKRTADVSEWRRICAVLHADNGIPIDEIACALWLSPVTVEKYLRDYHNQNKTQNDHSAGKPPKLNESESQELTAHLSKNTYLKVKAIASYVKKRFGIQYSRSGMTYWLKQHGFTYKSPQAVPGKLDPGKQKAFIEEYEKLKKEAEEDEEIYFVDAVHPQHQSQAVCGWIKKGERKTLQTSGKQLRLHFAGALSLKGMSVISHEYESVDADAMIHFFKLLEGKSGSKTIRVIVDNARSNKNKKLEAYLKTSRIKVHYLPPYSPNLNPIERLWKIMREHTVYNRYYESCTDFFKEVRNFFSEKIKDMKELLKSRINDKFQVIDLQPIQLA